jgi:hypothetical protein
MKIHPKIQNFIDLLTPFNKDYFKENELKVLEVLKKAGTTSTEAMVTLHLGIKIELEEAEKSVNSSHLWEPEHIQDIAYQTFLYMSDYEV